MLFKSSTISTKHHLTQIKIGVRFDTGYTCQINLNDELMVQKTDQFAA
jgi:hypothetical protein